MKELRAAPGARPAAHTRGAAMAKVSWNKTWSGKMRKKMKKHNGKNRSMKKKRK
jgi:hypothetical protein